MNQLILDNIDNTGLNVSFLADNLGISRSGLFAKVKSITNVTPNEMIQVIRQQFVVLLALSGGNQCYAE